MVDQRTRKPADPFDREIWTLAMTLAWIETVRSDPTPTLRQAKAAVRRCSAPRTSLVRDICWAAGTGDRNKLTLPLESCQELRDACTSGRLQSFCKTGPLDPSAWSEGQIVPHSDDRGRPLDIALIPQPSIEIQNKVLGIYFRSADVQATFPFPELPEPRDPSPILPHQATTKPARRGRPKGTGSFEKHDAALFDDVTRLIEEGKASSPHGAALQLVDKIPGYGKPESRANRLANAYRASPNYPLNKSD